nr:uncharacterized protein LOC105850668 [Hydra vulgaris]
MDTVQNLIEKEVSTCQQVAITTDGWTSRSQDPYMTLTLHYINSQFELKKYVLNFDNFVGRHTGYHISKALEEMIQKYPVLDAVPKKVIVHDAAANMKHAVSIMNKTKYESLLYADHLLNTSLLHATNEVQEVKECIDIATQLSSKVHRSTLACQLIEKECMLLRVNYVKIIAPVKTRWNSNCFMLESILKLKDVLISLREKDVLNNNPLQNVIPSDNQFSLMASLMPVLKKMKIMSDCMSKDTEPVLHHMLTMLYKTDNFLHDHIDMENREIVNAFCKKLSEHLHLATQFNEHGRYNQHYALGNLLHPYFRGYMLRHYGIFEEFTRKVINDHPSSDAVSISKKNNHKAAQVKMPVGVDECDDLQNIEIDQGNNNHTISQNVPEIEREFESFHAMPRVEEKHKVDVLKWWKKHASTLPLLAQLARNLLCIPAASSCSERVFSASGGIINDKRHSLSIQTAKQLTLIKVNYDLVCPHMTLKIISDAEEALDPPASTPVRTPPKNPIPKAVFSNNQKRLLFKTKNVSTTPLCSSSLPSTPTSSGIKRKTMEIPVESETTSSEKTSESDTQQVLK